MDNTGVGSMTAPPPPNSGPPFPGEPPGRPVRRLYRSVRNQKIGGVCGGVAEYFRLDPALVRIVAVALAVTGIGVMVYIAAWVLLPQGASPAGVATEPRRRFDRRTMLAIGAIVMALAFGIGDPFDSGAFDGVIVPLALIGGGVWLLSQRPEDDEVVVPTATTTRGEPVPMPSDPLEAYAISAGFDPDFAPPLLEDDVPPPVTHREPAVITRVVLSLLAMLIAFALVVGGAGWFDINPVAIIGIGLFIVGAGILAGAIVGGRRARGLILIGIVGLIALLPAYFAEDVVSKGVGERRFNPVAAGEIPELYELGAGDMEIDLGDLMLDGTDAIVRADVTFGRAEVIVPLDFVRVGRPTVDGVPVGALEIEDGVFVDGIGIEAESRFGDGAEVCESGDGNAPAAPCPPWFGSSSEGIDNELTAVFVTPTGEQVFVDVDVRFGEAEISRG